MRGTAATFALAAAALAAGALVGPQPGRAADFGLSAGYVLRGYAEWNVGDPVLLLLPGASPGNGKGKAQGADKAAADETGSTTLVVSPPADARHLLLWAWIRGTATFADRWSLVGSLDTTAVSLDLSDDAGTISATGEDSALLFDGRSLEDAAGDAALVRELYVDRVLGDDMELLLSAGKRRLAILDGLFYDDYGTSFEAQWDFFRQRGSTGSAGLFLLLPPRTLGQADPDLLVSGAVLSWKDITLGGITLGAFWMRDRNGTLAEMVRNLIVAEMMDADKWWKAAALDGRTLAGESDLLTAHASLQLEAGWLTLHALLARQWGSMSAHAAGRSNGFDADAAGWLALLEAPAQPLDQLTLTPYLLVATGTGPQPDSASRTLRSFVTLMPVSSRAAILMGGELNPLLHQPEYQMLGLAARGVSAAGLDVRFDPLPGLSVAHSSSVLGYARQDDTLFAPKYGLELDTAVSATLTPGLDLHAEADVLFPGDHFQQEDPMVRIVLGIEGEM